jgi:hypothetical protein
MLFAIFGDYVAAASREIPEDAAILTAVRSGDVRRTGP